MSFDEQPMSFDEQPMIFDELRSADVPLESGCEPRELIDLLDELLVEEQLGELLVLRAEDLVEPLRELRRRLRDVRAAVLVDLRAGEREGEREGGGGGELELEREREGGGGSEREGGGGSEREGGVRVRVGVWVWVRVAALTLPSVLAGDALKMS